MTALTPKSDDLEEGVGADFEAMRIERGWPTPNAMRSAADALDRLVIPRYGDVLRWMADACDGVVGSATTAAVAKLARLREAQR